MGCVFFLAQKHMKLLLLSEKRNVEAALAELQRFEPGYPTFRISPLVHWPSV